MLTYIKDTVMFPNIEHYSPSDYATFNQIKSFLLINIGLLLEREKKAKSFHFMLSLLSGSGFWQKLENVVENFLTVISNGTASNYLLKIKLLMK